MDSRDKASVLPNGVFRCSVTSTDASYIVSVYDDNIRKTIFMGRYTDLSDANKQIEEYKRKTLTTIKKTYLTY